MPSSRHEEFEMWGAEQSPHYPFDDQSSEEVFILGARRMVDFVFFLWYISPS